MSVTHAVRDTTIDGEKIENGQMIGMVDGKIDCVANTSEDCILKMTEKMAGASYITVFYGEEVDEAQAAAAEKLIRDNVPSAEIVCISGGQPIYSYVISVEK